MNERERLIELIVNVENEILQKYPYTTDTFRIAHVADYLLENGVVVPPCKVGDTVYQLDDIVWSWDCGDCEHFEAGWYDDPSRCGKTRDCIKCPECINITEETVTLKDILSYMCYESFGKTVFLTHEEAEQELQRRQGE